MDPTARVATDTARSTSESRGLVSGTASCPPPQFAFSTAACLREFVAAARAVSHRDGSLRFPQGRRAGGFTASRSRPMIGLRLPLRSVLPSSVAFPKAALVQLVRAIDGLMCAVRFWVLEYYCPKLHNSESHACHRCERSPCVAYAVNRPMRPSGALLLLQSGTVRLEREGNRASERREGGRRK